MISKDSKLIISLLVVVLIGVGLFLVLSPSEPTHRYLCLYHKDVMPLVKMMVSGMKSDDDFKKAPDIIKKIYSDDKQCVKITKDELNQFLSVMEISGLKIKIKWEDLKKSEKECNTCKSLIFTCNSNEECQSGSCEGSPDGSTCSPPQ